MRERERGTLRSSHGISVVHERRLVALLAARMMRRADDADLGILHLQTHCTVAVDGIVVGLEAVFLASLVEIAVPVLLVSKKAAMATKRT